MSEIDAARRALVALALTGWAGVGRAAPSKEPMTMNFSDPALARGLRVVNDGVMGGVSRSELSVDAQGVVFTGTVSLENNGGFASLRGPAAFPPGTSALALTARGDGKRYKLILRTDTDPRTPIHQCDFVAGDWRTHRFTTDGFRATFRGRDVSAPPLVFDQVVEFGILIADKQAGPFRIQLGELQAA